MNDEHDGFRQGYRPQSGLFAIRPRALREVERTLVADRLEPGVERKPLDQRQLLHYVSSHPALQLFDAREAGTLVDYCEVIRCPGGTVMLTAGSPADSVLFVLEGRVVLQELTATGNNYALRECGAGDVIGVEGVFAAGEYPYRAKSLTGTAALRFHSATLRELAKDESIVGAKLLLALSHHLLGQLWTSSDTLVSALKETSMRMTLNASKRNRG